MTFPVLVEPCEGQFAAVLVGAPQVRVVGSTREGAIIALKMEIAQREDDEDEGAVPKDLIIPRPPARQAKPKPSLDVAQFKKLLAKAKAGQL